MTKDPSFNDRLRLVEWPRYKTAYGSAEPIAPLLSALAGEDEGSALDACHGLWCSLCHQDIHVSDAAVPALPFMLEVLDATDNEVASEILEILRTFVRVAHEHPQEAWLGELRQAIARARPRIRSLMGARHGDVAERAGLLDQEIGGA